MRVVTELGADDAGGVLANFGAGGDGVGGGGVVVGGGVAASEEAKEGITELAGGQRWRRTCRRRRRWGRGREIGDSGEKGEGEVEEVVSCGAAAAERSRERRSKRPAPAACERQWPPALFGSIVCSLFLKDQMPLVG